MDMSANLPSGRWKRTWSACLMLVLGCATLVASTRRNEQSRALKNLLVRQSVSQSKNRSLERFHLAPTKPIVGRIEQILAAPADVNIPTGEEISVALIGSFHQGGRRQLKMGSMSREGRTRKRRYRGKAKKGMMMSKGKKGKGMSKGSKAESEKSGRGKGSLKDICADLDFGAFYGVDSYSSMASVFGGSTYGKGKAGKGKSWRNRSLQFDGELCSPSALEVAQMDPNLSIFVDLVEAVNLADIFLCAGPFTVLAPSNAAFNENPDLLTALFNPRNAEVVQELLLYHIVPGLFLTDDLVQGPLQTLLGDDVDVAVDPLMFNQAGVEERDILACNAVIDVIDDLLIPPDSPVLPEVCEILDFRTESQFPVQNRFAGIFNRRLTRSLQYRGERCQTNVLDTAKSLPELSTLVDLLEAADLRDLFLCAGPFTLLAPTNDAFNALDDDLIRQLLRPERKEVLQEILLYHILPNYQVSSSFQAGPTETLLVDALVQVTTNPVEFNRAGVITPDIASCNGVIHTIDSVLLPDANTCDRFDLDRRRLQDAIDDGVDDSVDDCDETLLDVARDRPELSTVVALIEAAGLEDLFDCGDFTGLLPNNDAFDMLDGDYVEFLMDPSNSDELEDLLLYHFLRQPKMTDELLPGSEPTVLAGETVEIRVLPLRFDESHVVTPNLVACRSMIHVVDNVLLPYPLPTQRPSPAPTAAPTPPDICDEFTFDRRRLQDGGKNCATNVLETARGNPDLSIATTLIDLAGLTDIFSCPGPFTALIPSNTVFDEVPQDFLDELVLPGNIDRLRELLLYHILPGATLTAEFTAGVTDTLSDGNQLTVQLNPLLFDGREVLSGDIRACNGYVHIIGGLLNPFPTLPPSATPSIAPNAAPVTDIPTASPVTGIPTASPVTEAPVTESPTVLPQPTLMPAQRLRIRDFYIAFVAEGAREPTQEEYMEMLQRTQDHFITYFTEFYADNSETDFISATAVMEETLFEAGEPEPRYNIYIGFDFTELVFTLESEVPTTAEMFDLMRTSISSDFILDSVRTFTGSPFATTTEAWFAATESDAPDP